MKRGLKGAAKLPLHRGSHPSYSKAVSKALDKIPRGTSAEVTKSMVRAVIYKFKRQLKNGKKWIETSMVNFYMGYYDGAIRFIDKEACGIQIFSLEELKQEIKEQPENFTDDIKFILKKFKNKIKPITKKREHTLND